VQAELDDEFHFNLRQPHENTEDLAELGIGNALSDKLSHDITKLMKDEYQSKYGLNGCHLINSMYYNDTFKKTGEAVLRSTYGVLSKPYEGRKVAFSHGLGISASFCMNAFELVQSEYDKKYYFKAEGDIQADGYFRLRPYFCENHKPFWHSPTV
jgi:hypothetical protein